MIRRMERSTIHVMAKRGKSIRQIAGELGRSPTTIAQVRHEPVDKPPTLRHHESSSDTDRAEIEARINAGLSTVRMLETAWTDPDQPYSAGHTIFGDMVQRIRCELAHARAP